MSKNWFLLLRKGKHFEEIRLCCVMPLESWWSLKLCRGRRAGSDRNMLTKKNPFLYLKIAADGASSGMLHQVVMTVGTLIYHGKSWNAVTLLQVSTWTLQNAPSMNMIYWVPSASGSGFIGKASKITFLSPWRTSDVFRKARMLESCTFYSLHKTVLLPPA